MSNFDDFKLSVEALSGGSNTVVLDDVGMPSVMFVMPKYLSSQLNTNLNATVHPAWRLKNAEKAKVYVSKYQNIVANGRAYSLPMQDPKTIITWDTALAACRAKGEYWGLTPMTLWGAIALWCKSNGSMPRGNNSYGKDYSYAFEKGVVTYNDGTNDCRTATGSGPNSWNHNNAPDGIADLNGNVYEWCAGFRVVAGEIQVIPDADCMISTCDMSAGSTEWKAILQDGTFVAPGTANTLKYDYVANKWALATTITSQTDVYRACAFKDMQSGGLTVPQILKEMAVFPADTSGYNSEQFYLNNGAGLERFPLRGGGWGNASGAGLFCAILDGARAGTDAYFGFRSAFYGE
ncbi:MAG: hypothetical protein RR365_00730 [Bacteroides sp.]